MLKVFCARSMHVAVRTLADDFARAGGAAADIVFEPMGALQARLAAGDTADVLILATPAIDAVSNEKTPYGVVIADQSTLAQHEEAFQQRLRRDANGSPAVVMLVPLGAEPDEADASQSTTYVTKPIRVERLVEALTAIPSRQERA